MSPKPSHPRQHDFMGGLARREAGDFTTDRRVLLLIGKALVIGTQDARIADVAFSAWMVLIPIFGGLVIGLMARFGSEKIRGHGIPEAIEAILIGGSRMSAKVAVLKPLSSALSIGTGGPFGAEGPIIMTGGAIGSLFAQLFHMSAAERKTLLVAGAAADMTAIFGSPIAAVLLAVELLLFEWKPRSFIPVTVAACVSISWRPLLFGQGPLFPTHFEMDLPWWGILLCAGMGIVTGLQSGLLTTLLYKIEDLFERLPIHWMVARARRNCRRFRRAGRHERGGGLRIFCFGGRSHRSYPVVGEANTLIGLVSRADALRWRREADIGAEYLKDRISDASIPIGHPDDTVGYIADIMIASDVARIPIIDPDSGSLMGLVARQDLLRLRQTQKSAELERRPYLGPARDSR